MQGPAIITALALATAALLGVSPALAGKKPVDWSALDAGVDEVADDGGVLDGGIEDAPEPEEPLWVDLPDHEPAPIVFARPPRDETGDPEEPALPKLEAPGGAWFLTRPFFSTRVGGGYFHPALDISKRHGPGIGLGGELAGFGKRFGLGAGIAGMFSQTSDERVTIPAGLENNDEPKQLTPVPGAIFVYLNSRVFLIKRADWLLSFGLSVGVMHSRFNFEEEPDKDLDRYTAYSRPRTGIGVAQDLEIAYLFTVGEMFQIGPFLSVGLIEAKTWPDDDVQPDLGRKDDTVYGLELWPQVNTGVRFVVAGAAPADPEQAEAERRSLDTGAFRLDFAVGYLHPFGKIAERHPPPGGTVDSYWMMRFKQMEAGLYLEFDFSNTSDDRPVLAADDPHNPSSRPYKMESEPVLFSGGAVFNPLTVSKKSLMLSLGVRLGIAYSSIGRGTKKNSEGDEEPLFDNYRRRRLGIAFGQQVEGAWFFARKPAGMVGLLLRLTLLESYTWNIDDKQPDLGRKDTTVYGIKWWPAVSGGIIVML